jgi:hypothetical protein
MFTEEVPVCNRCIQNSGSVERLQQHAGVPSSPGRLARFRTREVRGTGKISLFTPLDSATDFSANAPLKQKVTIPSQHGATETAERVEPPRRRPSWMKLLPSNVNVAMRPPTHSVLERRVSFPYFQSTRFSTPFMTPPEYPAIDPDYALAVSTAVQGVPDVWKSNQAPTPARSFRSISIPHSYAPSARRKRPPQTPTTRETVQNSYELAQSHTTDDKMLPEQQVSSPEAEPQRRRSGSSRMSQNLKLRTRDSLTQVDIGYGRRSHTPIPDQTISPAKPPFYSELSGFFTTRAGKCILPSRVSESRESRASVDSHHYAPSCTYCGAEVDSRRQQSSSRKADAILGEALCESCRVSSALPGGWLEHKY